MSGGGVEPGGKANGGRVMNSNEFSVLRKFRGDVQHQWGTGTAHQGLGGNCMCGEDAGQNWLESDHPGTSFLCCLR